MQLTVMAGTKSVVNFHNVGGAHGHKRYTDFTLFVTKVREVISKSEGVSLVCFTNSGQVNERTHLDTLGFSSKKFSGSSVTVHTIARSKLEKAFDSEELKKAFAEAERKLEEAKKLELEYWAFIGREVGDFRRGDFVTRGGTNYTVICVMQYEKVIETRWLVLASGFLTKAQIDRSYDEKSYTPSYSRYTQSEHASLARTWGPSLMRLAVKGVDY